MMLSSNFPAMFVSSAVVLEQHSRDLKAVSVVADASAAMAPVKLVHYRA